jgi:hypothetical protein
MDAPFHTRIEMSTRGKILSTSGAESTHMLVLPYWATPLSIGGGQYVSQDRFLLLLQLKSTRYRWNLLYEHQRLSIVFATRRKRRDKFSPGASGVLRGYAAKERVLLNQKRDNFRAPRSKVHMISQLRFHNYQASHTNPSPCRLHAHTYVVVFNCHSVLRSMKTSRTLGT